MPDSKAHCSIMYSTCRIRRLYFDQPKALITILVQFMHASSLENMRQCYQRYVCSSPLIMRDSVVVLDVGGADVNGGYREVFADPRYHYLTVDLTAGTGVDIVLEYPYCLPLQDSSVDIVLSGQMLEHCEFFWLTFAEMMRVLKPDGFLFLIAPSAGPIHSYPVDCYRFYPDAYRALAKYANCRLIDVWLDERGPWRDLVGVFAKHALPLTKARKDTQSIPAPFDPIHSPPGTAAEEATQGAAHYLEVLATLHKTLAPSFYLEIGVRNGHSLKLSQGSAIGVDPAPNINTEPLKDTTKIFTMTSDDYFADMSRHPLPQAPDMAFIDGMHLFECALRDFMHIEQLAQPGTLVVIDDIYPSHPAQAERTRRTRVWTGDIWKLHRCLAEERPDLFLLPLDTAPTGLLLVAGLDPTNRVLWDRYNPIVRKYSAAMEPSPEVLSRKGALSPMNLIVVKILAALKQNRNATRPEILARLRTELAAKQSA